MHNLYKIEYSSDWCETNLFILSWCSVPVKNMFAPKITILCSSLLNVFYLVNCIINSLFVQKIMKPILLASLWCVLSIRHVILYELFIDWYSLIYICLNLVKYILHNKYICASEIVNPILLTFVNLYLLSKIDNTLQTVIHSYSF